MVFNDWRELCKQSIRSAELIEKTKKEEPENEILIEREKTLFNFYLQSTKWASRHAHFNRWVT